MPGPMRTTWTLPRGTSRLAITAELPLESRAWGNLDLIVLVDGVERERHTLSAQSPEAHIRLDLASARELTLELDEGQFGPVQDRVELRVTDHVGRCDATSADTATGQRDGDMVETLDRLYGHTDFGVFAEVVTGGEIRIGDEITP